MKAIILSLLLCFAAQATITQVQQVTEVEDSCLLMRTGTSCSGDSCTYRQWTHIDRDVRPAKSRDGRDRGFRFHRPNMGSRSQLLRHVGERGRGLLVRSEFHRGRNYHHGDAELLRQRSRGMFFYEFSIGAGCFANFDSSGSGINASGLSQPGVSLSLTGTNDVIVQGIYGGTVSSIGGGYAEASGAQQPSRRVLAEHHLRRRAGMDHVGRVHDRGRECHCDKRSVLDFRQHQSDPDDAVRSCRRSNSRRPWWVP